MIRVHVSIKTLYHHLIGWLFQISNIKIPDLLVALSGSFGRRLAVTSQFRGVGSDSSLTLSYRGGGEEGRGDHDGGAITAPAPRGRQAGKHRPSERRFSRFCRRRRRRSLTLITGHTNKRVSERARGGMERMLWHLGNRPFTLRGRQTGQTPSS